MHTHIYMYTNVYFTLTLDTIHRKCYISRTFFQFYIYRYFFLRLGRELWSNEYLFVRRYISSKELRSFLCVSTFKQYIRYHIWRIQIAFSRFPTFTFYTDIILFHTYRDYLSCCIWYILYHGKAIPQNFIIWEQKWFFYF